MLESTSSPPFVAGKNRIDGSFPLNSRLIILTAPKKSHETSPTGSILPFISDTADFLSPFLQKRRIIAESKAEKIKLHIIKMFISPLYGEP